MDKKEFSKWIDEILKRIHAIKEECKAAKVKQGCRNIKWWCKKLKKLIQEETNDGEILEAIEGIANQACVIRIWYSIRVDCKAILHICENLESMIRTRYGGCPFWNN